MKYTIAFEIEVPDGLASAVNDRAYHAIVMLKEDASKEILSLSDLAGKLVFASRREDRPESVQQVWDELHSESRRIRAANDIVSEMLSGVTHAMNTADMEWRRSQHTK